MTQATCEYCGTVLSSIAMLLRHQASAKYCLKLRGEDKREYTCNCGKSFSYKSSLTRHQKKCTFEKPAIVPAENQDMLKLMTEMMTQLTTTIDKLANKPTNKQVNNNNQILNITADDFEKMKESFTYDIATANGEYCIKKIGISHAKFAKRLLADKYEVRDASRGKIRYKENDVIVDDLGCGNFNKIFYNTICEEFITHSENDWLETHTYIQKYESIASDTPDFFPVLQKSTNIKDLQFLVREAANGIQNNLTKAFTQEFLREGAGKPPANEHGSMSDK